MGIRFFCPNGHKLNVKEFQAGRRGICPFCGVRTLIPTQSTRPASKSANRKKAPLTESHAADDDSESAQASDSSPDILPGDPPRLPGDPSSGTMLGPSTPPGNPPGGGPVVAPPSLSAEGQTSAVASREPPMAPVAAAGNIGPAAARPAAPAPSPVLPPDAGRPTPVAPRPAPLALPEAPAYSARTVTAVPTLPAAASPPPAAPEPPDPIAEAPEMIWYVRPPSGGQFGPAAGELMRTWLSEGRVSADSLVWREGWREWLEAGAVFPRLRSNQIIDFLETTPVAPAVSAPAAHAHRPKAKHSSDRNQVALLVTLTLAVIILSVVFVVFLLAQYHR